jgi:hypothetical protein
MESLCSEGNAVCPSGKAFWNKRKAWRVSINSWMIERIIVCWLVSMSFPEPFGNTKLVSARETGTGDSGVICSVSFSNEDDMLPAVLSGQLLWEG